MTPLTHQLNWQHQTKRSRQENALTHSGFSTIVTNTVTDPPPPTTVTTPIAITASFPRNAMVSTKRKLWMQTDSQPQQQLLVGKLEIDPQASRATIHDLRYPLNAHYVTILKN
mmetsp:Transcript_21443/g.45215  ORF Transcript_21443/g.45215 Transcript_21443/m.45215 type:complete len:113 (-) Transcript_21443:177-515(-)